MILNTGCTLKSLGKHYKNNTWARSHRFWFFKFPDKSCIQGWKAWRYTFVSLRPVDLNQHVQESSGELVKNVDYGAFTRVLRTYVINFSCQEKKLVSTVLLYLRHYFLYLDLFLSVWALALSAPKTHMGIISSQGDSNLLHVDLIFCCFLNVIFAHELDSGSG